MSEHNPRVEPTRFETATAPTEPPPRPGSGNRWIIPALGGLLLLALLVVFWLPQRQIEPVIDVTEAVPARVGSPSPVHTISPWSEAQLARQRKIAQDILAGLLDDQFSLEELGVAQWAGADFAAAQALAGAGDEQYRQQDYPAAAVSYRRAGEAMQALLARVDDEFATRLQRGLTALTNGRADVAAAALELALLLRPAQPDALAALQRARQLPAVLDLLARAKLARGTGAGTTDELKAARTLLLQAQGLDPHRTEVQAQLAAIKRELVQRDFRQAMSAGYQALDGGRYEAAEREFLKARAILPQSTETAAALLQARSARTQARIDSYRQRAAEAGQQEDWAAAATAYRAILALDASVVFARSGLIQAETRAELDRALRAALTQPERLNDEAVYRASKAHYEQALALARQGPRLRQQLQQLQQLLRSAIVPVAVQLESDKLTDVTVYKVAHLGTFRHRQLSLKPGIYTAVGIRAGYRDVRREFRVSPERDNPVVEISCTERI